ncbi:hypothetical protein AOLI_G00105840 [Acnodon oligacanthus]
MQFSQSDVFLTWFNTPVPLLLSSSAQGGLFCFLLIFPQPTQHGVRPAMISPGTELGVGLAGPADHHPPKEAGQALLAEVTAQSHLERFPLGGCASLVFSYPGRCYSHASPTWFLGTPALQRTLPTLTATPADLHLLQSFHRL